MTIHSEREHRAAGDLERHPLHRFAQSTGTPVFAASFVMVSSVAAIMCGMRVPTARGVKAGASVRR